jgi:peptide/nickel transport system substrate-binding protein
MSKLKRLEALLNQGAISRREFIVRTSALGLAAAISPGIITSRAYAATPKKGGRLRIGSPGGSTTDSLDPGTLEDIMPQTCNQILRSHLVEITPDMKPVPELAESWEPSAKADQWVFKLRQGIEFHNGKTMTAEDVIDSINHHRGEDSKSAAKGIVDPIKDIKADGKYTVIFTLNEGNADFPYIMSDYHLSIFPAGVRGEEFQKGVGTGPFILVENEPGVRFLAKRNPNYFKEGKPYFDEIELLGIADLNARTNALKTGQIDITTRCEPKTFHFLEKTPGIVARAEEGMRHYTIPMLTTIKPYDNNDARLGLKYLIDRKQLVDVILRGYGYEGNDHPIPKINPYYAKEIPIRQYDPDKAKFHLKKAGLLDHTFNLHAADAAFQGAVDAAVLMKEQASKAGVKINVVKEPNDGYWTNVWMKKEWCMVFWSGRPTADWMFSTAYAADAGWNDAKWNHPGFNKLLVEARAQLDEAKRREMYVELQRIVRDEGATPCPMFAKRLYAYSEKLGHEEKTAANWDFDGMRIGERWWFKG